jgi:cytochrome b6-f complex iron-sulfur subunit
MPDINRRTFLAACAACAACPLSAALVADGASSEPEPVDVGTAADYPRDGAYDTYAASNGFFLVREKGRLYALGAICTHKRATLKVKGAALACPKHGARFDLSGKVTKPPAKRPLPRYAMSVDDAGRITVDPSRTIAKEKRGDDDASSVALS